MKKILLLITLFSLGFTQSQIVNIPDLNFKYALLNYSPTIDINNDGEIQESEAENIQALEIINYGILDLTGIQYFTNLIYLNIASNPIFDLNVNLPSSLKTLVCGETNISNFDFEAINNSSLESLYCYSNNNLTHLVINSTTLKTLNCSMSNITTIDVSNCTNLEKLICENNNITNLNLNNNINLKHLSCINNNLSTLNLSSNANLEKLYCYQNNLTSLNLGVQNNLSLLNCSNNLLTDIDLSQCNSLTTFYCADNLFYNLDLSTTSLLTALACRNNPNLTYLNLKNGNNYNFYTPIGYQINLPNLNNICLDNLNNNLMQYFLTEVNHPINFTEYCSLTFAQSNQINGNIKLDLNNNGCDDLDFLMNNLLVTTDNGIDTYSTFTHNNGDYLLYTGEGDYTTTVITNFTVNPNSISNTFTGFNNTFTADFCTELNQTINDVSISLIPTSQARPGFDIGYKIVYKNVGTGQLNGNITLEFDETKLSFLGASETVNSQTSNTLTFGYVNLNPFETRTIDLEFNVNAPPIVNINDILNFTATINPITGDYTTDDNIFTLDQTVVSSYDPNDITCLEGNQILLADADKYLHYVIRFQNTGTASAINVVVRNYLDQKLDWSTLQLESSSHNNRVAIKNGNEIEFIFENINLLDSTTDEPNSHGFIAYKIKPKTDIALDDIIPNKADIFFDFNAPIETNTATTTIVNALSVNENTLLDFYVFPTPTENILNINSKTEIVKIEIYSKLGQLIKNTTRNKIDISNLTQGLYFVKVEDENGNFGIKKIVKK